MFTTWLPLLLFAALEETPVEVWVPTPAPAAPAPVVIYVHGYRSTARAAIEDHRLYEQFAASGRNAVFIVPEAPSGPREPVYHPELETVLSRVERERGVELSRAELVIIGHSGAYRTLRSWLEHPGVREVIMLDAMYGDTAPFARWIERAVDARLTIVSHSTLSAARAFLSRLDRALIDSGRVVHRSVGAGHMEIVTAGRILPALLSPHRQSARRFAFG